MKKIIDGLKYDTDTAILKAEWKNEYVRKYLWELERFYEEHPELKPAEDVPTPPNLELGKDDPFFQEDEPDFDWTDKTEPEDPKEEENKGGSELEEDDDDDFQFFSSDRPVPLADDFDFDDIPELKEPEEEPDFDFDKEPEGDDEEGEGEQTGPEDAPEEPEEIVWPRISPQWRIERLYQKDSTGEWFLVRMGGRLSGVKKREIKIWRHAVDDYYKANLKFCLKDHRQYHHHDHSERKRIHATTWPAFEWACEKLSVDEVEKIFGEVNE